jgi:acylphosphatase
VKTSAVHVIVEGRVQGVGYRAFVEREAKARGLRGWVRNRSDGSVEAVFAGEEEEVQSMIVACHRGPRMSVVRAVRTDARMPGDWKAFEVWPTV